LERYLSEKEEREMIIREPEIGGVRAWVLIRVESPEAAAGELFGTFGYPAQRQDDPWVKSVMVRADVVDYHYNIVIPVDAESQGALQDTVCAIQKQTGATEMAVLRVTAHFPEPPHDADGYITQAEADLYMDTDTMRVGRQKNSPGMNPWG